jgi:hypothetical protein
MDGIKAYDVCVVFTTYADNDDDALSKVRDTLSFGLDGIGWAWIYTTLNKGEASDTND